MILNDQEQLELQLCLVRKAPSVLSAEPPLLCVFSQTHPDAQAGQLNTLLCLMLSERKVVPAIDQASSVGPSLPSKHLLIVLKPLDLQ